jgi:putative hydrolase of the HAD superfamily
VLFDLGGVTCRFFPERRLEALSRASGLPAEEVHRRLFASGFDQDCDRGRYTLEEQCAEICARLEVQLNVTVLANLWKSVFEPDREVLAVIDRVRRNASASLLSNNGPLVHLVVQQFLPEVAARFDQLCFSYEVSALKPEPRAYLATLERLRVRPDQCVFVDDAEQNVEGARAVGIDALHFASAETLERELRSRDLAE